ncbi:hypothetical protein KL86DYS1_11934 [uncultured Dysgonomonas sp.]|uniref:Uncharacterized protein n=1 Tax=uncultured Dysgonomonas sp. TaxID=206096 RepID=A0A212JDQ7_9BACT|nr:hypothetical protein KL86DYS1_11934 [uncultured Dysgonomonas sp.]
MILQNQNPHIIIILIFYFQLFIRSIDFVFINNKGKSTTKLLLFVSDFYLFSTAK